MPGFFTRPSFRMRASRCAFGLSMQRGTSVAPCMRSMSQHMVSYSISVAVDGAQSRKFAPASACAFVRSMMRASLWSAIACLMEGIAPLIFSQIRTRFTEKEEAAESLTLYSIGNYFSFIMKNYFQYDTRALNLKLVPNAAIAEALFSGDADVAIADDTYLQVDPKVGLKRIPILSEQLLLMIPHGHELCGRSTVDITDLADYPIMRLNTNFWLDEIAAANHVKLNLPWSVDSQTWTYYWGSYMGNVPLCFDTSASFVTHNMIKARKRRCEIAKVTGNSTRRMLYLWYFEKNEERLEIFLNCVRMSFLQ